MVLSRAAGLLQHGARSFDLIMAFQNRLIKVSWLIGFFIVETAGKDQIAEFCRLPVGDVLIDAIKKIDSADHDVLFVG